MNNINFFFRTREINFISSVVIPIIKDKFISFLAFIPFLLIETCKINKDIFKSKRTWFYICFFTGWVILKNLIDKNLFSITPTIKNGDLNIYGITLLCLIIFIYLIIVKGIKKTYLFSSNIRWISLITIIIYLSYRLNSFKLGLRFTRITLNCFLFEIAYLDIILFISSLIILENIIAKTIIHTRAYIKKNNDNIIAEKPISTDKEDKLGRVNIAKKLAEKIIIIPLTQAFAIGITGKWGEGKSSLFNLLKQQIENKDKSGIIVEFTPWQCNNEKNITTHFLDSLYDALKPYSGELASTVRTYTETLISTNGGSYKDFLNIGLDMISDDEKSYLARKNKVAECIKTLNRRIYILFDDLDRLYTKEIIECLRIIRNTANFPNTLYVVAYDNDYIQKALKEELKDNWEGYTEKIFQINFTLPKAEKQDLEDYFNIELIKIGVNKNDLDDIRINHHFRITNYIDTIRQCNRLINDIWLAKHFNNYNLNLTDIFLIAILRTHFNDLGNKLINDFNINIIDGKYIINSINYTSVLKDVNKKYLESLIISIFNRKTKNNFSPNIKKIFQFYYDCLASENYLDENYFDSISNNFSSMKKLINKKLKEKEDIEFISWKLQAFEKKNNINEHVILVSIFYIQYLKNKKYDNKNNIDDSMNNLNKNIKIIQSYLESKDPSIIKTLFNNEFIKEMVENLIEDSTYEINTTLKHIDNNNSIYKCSIGLLFKQLLNNIISHNTDKGRPCSFEILYFFNEQYKRIKKDEIEFKEIIKVMYNYLKHNDVDFMNYINKKIKNTNVFAKNEACFIHIKELTNNNEIIEKVNEYLN